MIEIPCLLDEGTKHHFFDWIAGQTKNDMNFYEIGSFLGGSICTLGQKLKEKNIIVKMTAVDNWEFGNISLGHLEMTSKDKSYYEQFEENVKKCNLSVTPLIGDSIEISKFIKNNTIDFLFIDGDHSYPYVKKELDAWIPKMKKDSILAGHDYSSSDAIRKAVHETFPEDQINFTENKDSYYVVFGKGLC